MSEVGPPVAAEKAMRRPSGGCQGTASYSPLVTTGDDCQSLRGAERGKGGGKVATDPHARVSSAVVRITAALGSLCISPPPDELTPRPLAFSIRGRQATELVAAGFSPPPLSPPGRGANRRGANAGPIRPTWRGGDEIRQSMLLICDVRFP